MLNTTRMSTAEVLAHFNTLHREEHNWEREVFDPEWDEYHEGNRAFVGSIIVDDFQTGYYTLRDRWSFYIEDFDSRALLFRRDRIDWINPPKDEIVMDAGCFHEAEPYLDQMIRKVLVLERRILGCSRCSERHDHRLIRKKDGTHLCYHCNYYKRDFENDVELFVRANEKWPNTEGLVLGVTDNMRMAA